MTTTLRALAALCLSLLALAGCGSTPGGSGSDPATLAPASSFLYVEATIDPEGSQQEAVRSILADLPGSGAPEQRIEDLIRKGIREGDEKTKLDWDKDIKPWLGDKVGAFLTAPGGADANGAFVVATTDEDAARDALEKDKEPGSTHRTYRDVDYIVEPEDEDSDVSVEAVVDGFVVAGDEAGVKAAIDASKAQTLAESDRFKQATDDVSDERVGYAYVDVAGLLQLAAKAAGEDFPAGALFGRLLGGKPLVITARAENQALVFESSGAVPGSDLVKTSGDPRAMMESLPAGSWAALSLPGFGETVRSAISVFAGFAGGEQALADQIRAATGLDLQRDVLSWIGDVGMFADGEGEDTVGGGVVIESKDPETSKRALTRIAATVARTSPETQVAAAKIPGAFGYQLRDPDIPRGLFVVQAGDKVAMTYGEDEARKALSSDGLGGNADFKRAADGLGGDHSPAFYVAVPPILRLADAFGASDDADYAEARPYLTILDYVIAGSHDGKGRLRVGFKPHE